jgi:hypothetical protein
LIHNDYVFAKSILWKMTALIEAIAQPKVSVGFDAIADHRALSIFAAA